MRKIAIIILCALASVGAFSRTKTTIHKLTGAHAEIDTIAADAMEVPEGIDLNAITIKGYSKKASDSKETFFVTNNTQHRISQIKIRLRYSAIDGKLLHERVATVNVTLRAGETQLVAIRSWDLHRQFYYYAGTKPRKSASAYKIAYRLIGYSIPVGE